MPHPDGQPFIAEIIADALLAELGDTSGRTGVEIVAVLEARLHRLPTLEEIEQFLGFPESASHFPPEEKCKGCDRHRSGPHRFGCFAFGTDRKPDLTKRRGNGRRKW